MRDRDLEDKIARLKEIISLWNRFNEITGAVLKGAEAEEDTEREFLELKSSIARKYQSLADRFPQRTFPDEEINGVLAQAVSLGHLKELTSFAGGEFQNQWHKVYISFNRQLGHLESERDQLRKISSFGVFIRRIVSGKLFKLAVVILIIAGIIAAGQRLGLIDVEEAVENGEEIEEAHKTVRDHIRDFINRFRSEDDGGEDI